MPDETPAQPAISVPAPGTVGVHPATPPPPAGESFFQKMERLGGFGDGPVETEKPLDEKAEPAKPAAEAETKTEKPAKAKKGAKGKEIEKPAELKTAAETENQAEPSPEQKLETLRTLAKDLGLVIDDNKVVANERAELRIAKRDHQRRVEEEQRGLVEQYNQAVAAIQPELDKARAVMKALDEGDADELAKLAGAKDWNEAQERFIAKMTDPNWKKIRDLERQVEADKREKTEHEQRLQQQSEHNKKLVAERTYQTDLAKAMKQSQDPICRELSDDPAFVNAIFQIQRENWDGSETVTAEQALKMAVKGAPMSVREELEQHYRRLHKVFGAAVAAAVAEATPPVAAEPAKAPDRPGARPRPKTGIAPAATAGAPSPPGKFKDAAERRAYNLARLKEAADAERRTG